MNFRLRTKLVFSEKALSPFYDIHMSILKYIHQVWFPLFLTYIDRDSLLCRNRQNGNLHAFLSIVRNLHYLRKIKEVTIIAKQIHELLKLVMVLFLLQCRHLPLNHQKRAFYCLDKSKFGGFTILLLNYLYLMMIM